MSHPLDAMYDNGLAFQERECPQLDNVLRGIMDGDTDELSLRLELFIAFQMAKYKPISLKDIHDVVNGVYHNDQFDALCQAFLTFAQSDSMPSARKLKPRTLTLKHLYMGAAVLKFTALCNENFSEEERKKILADKDVSWEDYVNHYAHDTSRR